MRLPKFLQDALAPDVAAVRHHGAFVYTLRRTAMVLAACVLISGGRLVLWAAMEGAEAARHRLLSYLLVDAAIAASFLVATLISLRRIRKTD